MPSGSGLQYWIAMIAVMAHLIFGVFYSGENWHVSYENRPDCQAGFEIRRSFVSGKS